MRHKINDLLDVIAGESDRVKALRMLDSLADEIALDLCQYDLEARISHKGDDDFLEILPLTKTKRDAGFDEWIELFKIEEEEDDGPRKIA